MKMALPTNSRRDISGLVLGIRRFTTKPARNAPSKPSNPTILANEALRNTNARTKMYCMTLSSYLRRNHRPKRGKIKSTAATYTIHLQAKITHVRMEVSGLRLPITRARTSRLTKSAKAVATTLFTTVLCLPRPYRPTMG